MFMALQITRGLLLFPESRFAPRHVRRARTRDLVGFAGWSFLGSLAWQLRTQGGQILLNVYFGPSVNAAYAVANQAAMYLNNFAGAIVTAARPAMTSLEGRGQRDNLHHMVMSSSKLTVVLLACLAVPLLLETRLVLELWLGRPPHYSVGFVFLTVLWVVINQLTTGHAAGIVADGRIGTVMFVGALITLAPLPVGALLYITTAASPLWYVGLIVLATAGNAWFRVWYIGRRLGIPRGRWWRQVLSPTLLTLTPGLLVGWAVVSVLEPGVRRLLLLGGVFGLMTLVTAWHWALRPAERDKLRTFTAARRGRQKSA